PAADPARWPEESLAAGLDFGRGDYPAISGFHDLEPGLRWSPGRSTVVLRRDAQRYLTLSVTVPTVARFKEQGLGPQAGVALTVAAGPCPPAVLPVERDGHLGATLELCPAAADAPPGRLPVVLSLNSAMRRIDTLPDGRRLAFALHALALADAPADGTAVIRAAAAPSSP
ncbi:MAG TPA: hypothetical protein VEB20_12505, partial [Azospirillaceae bacterium]|nr:hypothetical protein [Azospirillaceae bacterium]